METSIVAVEENRLQSESNTPVTKSSGSVVKNIDSISVHLNVAMEKNEAEQCQPFSIRGYVAEMRIKDWRICSPFALDGTLNVSEEQLSVLPPLHVPKFRWWRCQNCLQEIGSASAAEEIGLFSRSGTCSHIPSHVDTAMVPSDLQLASQLGRIEGRKADANRAANLNGDETYLSSCSYKKQKTAEVGHMANAGIHFANLGHENCAEDVANQDTGSAACDVTKFNLCPSQDRLTDITGCEAVVLKLNNIGLVDRSQDDADVVPASEYPAHTGNNFAEISLAKKANSGDDERRTEWKAFEISKQVSINGNTIRGPSLELERHDVALSEGDELLAGINHHDQQPDDTSGLPHQKMRLLSDLMSEKENAENDHTTTEGASSRTLVTASVGLASVSAPMDLVVLQENVSRVFKGPQRKRRAAQDGDQKPLDVSCPDNLAKKVRAFCGDPDTPIATIEISDSELEEDASAGVGLQSGIRTQWSKHGIARSPTLVKKNNEQTYSSPVSGEEVMPDINQIKMGDANKSGAAAGSSFPKKHDEFLGRGTQFCFERHLSPRNTERKSSLSKTKNKMPQIGDGQFSLMPQSNSMFGGGSINRKDIGFMQAGPNIGKAQLAHKVSANLGLDLTLNSYMSAQRNQQILAQEKGTPSKDPERKDGIYVGESSILHKSAPTPSLREELICDLNERAAQRTAMLCEKQNGSPLLEDGFSLHRNLVDFSGHRDNQKTLEVHGHSEVPRKHSDQGADKVLEQGTSDDIPMEIVELMARNQYERGLCQTETNHGLSERPHNMRNAEMMGFADIHGKRVERSSPKDFPWVTRFPSGNGSNDIIPMAENYGATKRNLVNFSHGNASHLNMGQLERNSAFTMINSFPQIGQKLSRGVQLSAREWYGDKMAHRTSPAIKQILETNKTSHIGSRHNNKAEHIWSPMAPNQMPFGFNASQKNATPSSNMETHAQSPFQLKQGKVIRDLDLNSVDPDASNLEKENENYDFESLKQASAEYSFFPKQRREERNPNATLSLEPYSNDTITAMQLLSLMDGTPFKMDPKKFFEKPLAPCDYHPKFLMNGKQNFLEKSSFPYHPSREFTGLGPGAFDARASSGHPSSVLDGKISTRSQEQENRSSSPKEKTSHKAPQSVSASGVLQAIRDYISVQDKQKGIIGDSNCTVLPLKCHALQSSTKCCELGACSLPGSFWPMKNISKYDICSFNRNPADFSIPEAGNVYMICGEDLKFEKKKHSRDRSSSVNVDGRKRQRFTKLKAEKEHAHRVPKRRYP
ncbi:unnamed protein product [Ilex paraguariensis]|uniref:Protein EMBRYONIC FLOWER 1-like n=1 Tax=Ilex paraguariensis TaxID=185542 RepID=A0ABC8QYH1_9AQUA